MPTDAGDPPRPVLPPLPPDVGPTPREPEPPESSPPRRRRRAGSTVEGRRLQPAGHAIVVAVLALAIGMLLNAPGSHKSAYNQSAGWQRDAALAITGPLAGTSHALGLDRPRAAVQSAIGRSGQDDIDVQIVAAPPPAVAPTPAPAPRLSGGGTKSTSVPRKVSFTPQRKLRLWIAGDSLMITPGYSITRAAGGSPVIDPVGGIDGRVATGLTRPDVFNWFNEIRDKVRELKPNVVVLCFGGNDDKAYMTGLPPGTLIAAFGDAAWTRQYRRRLGIVFDTVARAGGRVIWIGLPLTRSPAQTQRFDVVNAAVLAEAEKRPRTVTYLDTYTTFAGPNGGYAAYLANKAGQLEKVRADDGVHFEQAGGDIIARAVLKRLNELFDLTSWRKKARQQAAKGSSASP